MQILHPFILFQFYGLCTEVGFFAIKQSLEILRTWTLNVIRVNYGLHTYAQPVLMIPDKGFSLPPPLQAAGVDDLVTTRNVTLFSCPAGEVGP